MVIIYCCWGGHLKKRTMIIGNYLAISFFSLVLFNYFSFFSLFSFSLFLFSLFFYFFRQPLGERSPPSPPSDPPLVKEDMLRILGCRKILMVPRQNLSANEEVARSSISSLIWAGWSGMTSEHHKHVPTFPLIDSCLIVTKRGFSG